MPLILKLCKVLKCHNALWAHSQRKNNHNNSQNHHQQQKCRPVDISIHSITFRKREIFHKLKWTQCSLPMLYEQNHKGEIVTKNHITIINKQNAHQFIHSFTLKMKHPPITIGLQSSTSSITSSFNVCRMTWNFNILTVSKFRKKRQS